jgi:hypothetical protein
LSVIALAPMGLRAPRASFIAAALLASSKNLSARCVALSHRRAAVAQQRNDHRQWLAAIQRHASGHRDKALRQIGESFLRDPLEDLEILVAALVTSGCNASYPRDAAVLTASLQ